MNARLQLLCYNYLQAGVSQEILKESPKHFKQVRNSKIVAISDIIFRFWDSYPGIPANINTPNKTTQVTLDRKIESTVET